MYGLPLWVVAAIGVAVLFLVALGLFKLMWRVAEPNEALIISGNKTRNADDTDESLTFRIVTGRGTFVIPGVQTVRRLMLNLEKTDLLVECVTSQGVPVKLRGSVIFKIGDTFPEIANAARRFLGQQELMVDQVHSILEGHLREIVGALTVEELIGQRETLRAQVREASGVEMAKLGLKIDSLQILEITDPTGYIENLAAPHNAAVASRARIAQADRGREAAEAESRASVLTAEAQKEADTKRAAFDAEVQRAQAEAAQAGPLAEATARQKVVVQETEIAQLEAQRQEQRLVATVRKQADADAYQMKVGADAARDAQIAKAEADAKERELLGQAEAAAIRVRGEAEAEVIRVTGEAEAATIKARGEAVAANQDAVIAQTVAENLPAIVTAAAAPLGNIKQLTVLDGASGVTDIVGQVLGQAGALLPAIMGMLGKGTAGSQPADTTPDTPAPELTMAHTSTDGRVDQ